VFTERVVAADLPYYQHHHPLQICRQKNLGLEAVNWKTVTKVGMVPLHPLCQQMRNISPHCCPNLLRFLVFDSKTADEPVLHTNLATVHFSENCGATTMYDSKI
jgi:hypothetical protein